MPLPAGRCRSGASRSSAPLGGTLGLGTVLYAVVIGPTIHNALPAFRRGREAGMAPAASEMRA